ncbi:MAG: DUF5063 domain-containing protein [Bacteroidales bacterium]|nr:DUF5063 domain-containing protein [Bacteroidales bacterium]
MDIKSIVYSRNVVEFATVAREYCAFLENVKTHSRKSFVSASQKLLPLLYYKTSILPETEPIFDEGNEKFVTEDFYFDVQNNLKLLLGPHDDFLEIYDPRADEGEGLYTASISEYLTDIWQDLKNFTMLYQVGKVEVMNDALWECRSNFQEYWGIRLANTIRAMHILLYTGIDLEQESETDDEVKDPDTSNWFITRRQNDLNSEN